ncbi:MAG: nucleoside-diphosphate kinase [bacterium]
MVIIKPHIFLDNDAQKVSLIIGDILRRYLERRLSVVAVNSFCMDRDAVAGFYQEHNGRPFFNDLINAMIAAPSFFIVLEGEYAVQKVRSINGATNPLEAAQGTLRRDYGRMEKGPNNAVHGSDSVESAEREIACFFPELAR